VFALQVHLTVCQWAVENCASYIAFIEESLQKVSRKALHTNISERIIQRENSTPLASPLRASSWRSNQDTFSFRRTDTGSTLAHSKRKWRLNLLSKNSDLEKQLEVDENFDALPITRPQLETTPSPKRNQPGELPPSFQSKDDPSPGDQFSFGDLQYTQQLEEKAQEAHLVISLNQTVLKEIRQYFLDVLESEHVPTELRTAAITDFSDDIRSFETDLSLIMSRFEALLQLIGHRKQLVCFFLQTAAAGKAHEPRCSASSNTASCWLAKSSGRGLRRLQTSCRR